MLYFFWSNIAINLFLGLRKVFHPSKENNKHFKTWNFFTFMGHSCPSGFGSGSSRQNEWGSGSTTLVFCWFLESHWRIEQDPDPLSSVRIQGSEFATKNYHGSGTLAPRVRTGIRRGQFIADPAASAAKSPGTTSYESRGFTLYGYDLLNMSLSVARTR